MKFKLIAMILMISFLPAVAFSEKSELIIPKGTTASHATARRISKQLRKDYITVSILTLNNHKIFAVHTNRVSI